MSTRRSLALLLVCFALASAAPRTTLNIGFSPSDSSVVANGVVNPMYMPGSTTPQEVTAYTPWLELFLSLSGGADQQYFASASNNKTSVVAVSVDPVTDWGKITVKHQIALRVMFVCSKTGSDTFTLTITFPPLSGQPVYDTISLSWYKTCRTGDPHPGFAVATHDWHADSPAPDVVSNGVVTPIWVGDDQTGNFNLLDPSVNSLTFYLWMVNGSAQPYNVVASPADINAISLNVAPTSGLARPPNAGFATSQFTIGFSCLQSSGFAFVSVSISVDPFDPFTIAWFKNCQGAVVPSGMSAVGVFFLVSFLLLSVGCMAGCAFKYYRLHARGMDVIPGIDTWRGLYSRVCNRDGPGYDNVVYKSSVGPQAQFDQAGSNDSNPFKSSYQNL
jgi:hypothetical protein